jgi:transposase
MGKPYSEDLRKRVVSAVETGGLSCNQAAKRFGVAIARPFYGCDGCERPAAWPGKIGGYRPKAISGERRGWLLQRIKRDFTLRGMVAELAERGLKVDYRSVWEFVHAEKLSLKKAWWLASAIVPTWPGDEPSGSNMKIASKLSVWSSSMRPGPEPTWHPCGDGRPAAKGSLPKFRTAAGRP